MTLQELCRSYEGLLIWQSNTCGMQSKPMVFYDIASGPPVQPFAPNPWKARYALNFKGVTYRTEWVELPDVTDIRKRLGAAPNRVHADGRDFYTLPIIQDPSNNDQVVGDSFEIAMYLDQVRPDGPRLLPGTSLGLYRVFNTFVDALFTNCVSLMLRGMPLNPETARETHREFERRALGVKWEDLGSHGDARAAMFDKLRTSLGELNKAYKHSDGPFLDGEIPTYADIIVGAWLQYAMRSLSKGEWEHLLTWHDGVWRNLHQGLEQYAATD